MFTLKYLIHIFAVGGIITCVFLDEELLGLSIFAVVYCLDKLIDFTAFNEAMKRQGGNKK